MIITWTELKDARALRGWTQQELAEALGVHQKTIVNWEAKGVPPKSAYKVQRALREELAFVEHKEMNPSDQTSFEEFREEWRRQQHIAVAAARSDYENRPAEVDERLEIMQLDQDYEVERQQAAYDARVALHDTLAQFDSITLLREVEERIRQMQTELRSSVSAPAETADEDFNDTSEVRSADDRAARRGPRKSDQPHAE